MDLQKTEDEIVSWIKEQVRASGCRGLIVGLSGGIDSSLVAVLSKKAFPDATLGVIMPCDSNPKDMEHAKLVAKKFGVECKIIDLSNTFKTLFAEIEKKEPSSSEKSLEIANLKPRLRMSTLYYFANKNNYLVVGTDNKSEEYAGYFTKYGDGGVDILPIVDLLKRDVRRLSVHLGIPDEIIAKAPSAGLWKDQTDEGEMGITYDQLDEVLDAIEKKDTSKCRPEILKRVNELIRKSDHKRKMPPGCVLNK